MKAINYYLHNPLHQKNRKMVLLYLSLTFFCTASFARTQPPDAVKRSFEYRFPKVTEVNWSKGETKEWDVRFKLDGYETTAIFDSNGKWIETAQEISIFDLPDDVGYIYQLKYPHWSILTVYKIINPIDGVTYDADIKKNLFVKDISISGTQESIAELITSF